MGQIHNNPGSYGLNYNTDWLTGFLSKAWKTSKEQRKNPEVTLTHAIVPCLFHSNHVLTNHFEKKKRVKITKKAPPPTKPRDASRKQYYRWLFDFRLSFKGTRVKYPLVTSA